MGWRMHFIFRAITRNHFVPFVSGIYCRDGITLKYASAHSLFTQNRKASNALN